MAYGTAIFQRESNRHQFEGRHPASHFAPDFLVLPKFRTVCNRAGPI